MPELIKNEFIKYGGNKLREKLTSLFNEILNHEQIPQSWPRSMIINIDKGKKSQFTDAQAGARENRAAVDQIFTLKAIIQNKTLKGQPTYITLIDLEKAFDKTWVQGVFFNLWNRGIKDKIWRIMLKLKHNRTCS